MRTMTFYMYLTAGPSQIKATIQEYERQGWAVRTLYAHQGVLWIVLEEEEEI